MTSVSKLGLTSRTHALGHFGVIRRIQLPPLMIVRIRTLGRALEEFGVLVRALLRMI